MRFVFDTSVLIDYLRDPNDTATDALLLATERGEVFVSLISIMELCLSQNRRQDEIEREVRAIKELCSRLNIKIVACSQRSQEVALDVLRASRPILGRNALPDSMILGTGSTRRAYLVTRDRNWSRIVCNKVITPETLIERFG